MAIRAPAGPWLDHAHGCKGDLLSMIAGYARLDIKRDFVAVLELARKIGGEEWSAPRPESRRGSLPTVEKPPADPALTWESLARRSADGESYLRGRGLAAQVLIERGAVRFFGNGDIAVALRSIDTGEVVNVIRRRRVGPYDGPKVLGLRGCTTLGTLVGSVADVGEGLDIAVVTEGVADTLAAIAAWPTCAVVGAHGARRITDVVEAVAPRLARVQGWLLLVPHADGGVGEQATVDAVRVAMRSGLTLDGSIQFVDVLPSKDLAEAVQRAGAPRWPT
ncbi:MAG: hypothetical protein K8M05_28920 [Deltaproteobacteria bacterium]|nr:hypothetical protein [Kofleriaceae bacterium]